MEDHIEFLRLGRSKKKKIHSLERETKAKVLFLLGVPQERRHRTPEVPFLLGFVWGGGESRREQLLSQVR